MSNINIQEIEFLNHLLEKKHLTKAEVKEVKRTAKKAAISLCDAVISKGYMSEKELLQALSLHTDTPIIDLGKKTVKKETLALIPHKIAKENHIIPFKHDNKTIHVAIYKPGQIELFQFLEKKTKRKIKRHLALKSSIKDSLLAYEKPLKEKLKEAIEGIKAKGEKQGAEAIANLLNEIVYQCALEHASDIHIEPQEAEIVVRSRKDGILKDILFLPKSFEEVLISRIKVLANLRTDEHRKAQDGRIKMEFGDMKASLRVSIIPIYDGEKAVLRILASQASLDLEDLGYSEDQMKIFRESIKKTHGMILVTGPTGCGKTTTLYSALLILNRRDINISTIEDPIEIRLQGANQIQVNNDADLTFANGLRSILRQDPDVVLVGEIRDLETAKIGVNAALTGHLVFATLHTNDAASSLPRLLEMGVEHFLAASTINVVIAQRLARRICPYCKESKTVTLNKVLQKFENFENFSKKEVLKYMKRKNKVLPEKVQVFEGKGCKACHKTGFLGRIVIAEFLEITKEIRKLITKKTLATDIVEKARENGMLTLMEDGLLKALEGNTSTEEVLRVTRE